MMTSPSNPRITGIITDIEETGMVEFAGELVLTLTKSECEALLKECMHSYISYENPLAREVVTKMWKFVGQPLKRSDGI